MQTNHSQQPHLRGATRLKCIILGSANAGKTCLLRRYVHGKFEDDIEVSKSTKRISRSTNSTLGADYYVKKTGDNGSVFVQLWDTAGKERLKPQKIPNEYDKKSNYYQFLSISIKDSNAKNTNHYEHRYNNWGNGTIKDVNEETQSELHSSYREHGRSLHNRWRNNQAETSKPLGDSLFRNVHVCMLVYDATSSTSFLHLMQWHSEWIQKLKHWEEEDMAREKSKDDNMSLKKRKRRRRVPFIVVASKIDLIREEKVSPCVRQDEYRSVMGFPNGEYKGKGYAYEYAAEDDITDESEADRQPEYGRRHKKLTYSLKETSWSNDATYLKSLQQAEDQLPANRLMILLWCKRNRIPHVEASALTGEGVTEAMEMLVQMGVTELETREQEQIEQERQQQIEREKRKKLEKEKNYFVYQPRYDKDLDLFARYSSDDEKRCSIFSCFRSFFSTCLNT